MHFIMQFYQAGRSWTFKRKALIIQLLTGWDTDKEEYNEFLLEVQPGLITNDICLDVILE